MEDKRQNIFTMNFAVAVILAYCIASSLNRSFALGMPLPAVTAAVPPVLFLMDLLSRRRVLFRIVTGIMALSGALALNYIIFRRAFRISAGPVENFTGWFTGYISGREPYQAAYGIPAALLLLLLVSGFFFIFCIRFFNYGVLLLGGGICYPAMQAWGFAVSHASFYIYIFLMLVLCFASNCPDSTGPLPWGRSGKRFFHTPLLWLAATGLSVLLAATALPAGNQPLFKQLEEMDIPFLNNTIFKDVTVSSFEQYSLAATGFGGAEGRLGGRIRPDRRKVLSVTTPVRVYLKGVSKDSYDGSSWKVTGNSFHPLNTGLINFSPYEVGRYSYTLRDKPDDFTRSAVLQKMTVRFENMSTKTIFYPLYPKNLEVSAAGRHVVSRDKRENMLLLKPVEKGFTYAMDFYSVNYKEPQVIDILKKSRKGLFGDMVAEELNQYLGQENGEPVVLYDAVSGTLTLNPSAEDTSKMPFAKNWFIELNPYLAEYRRYLEVFLQLPGTLPPRVKEFAGAVTADSGNDYERIKALERYLAKEYKYTSTPGDTPEKWDFADYFLFELKEGYCTYYATAMVVMARSLGIPARYVEGYALPQQPVSGDRYEITNELAHAWVEVYFEGFGWVPFEPTTPFYSAYYSAGRGGQAEADGMDAGGMDSAAAAGRAAAGLQGGFAGFAAVLEMLPDIGKTAAVITVIPAIVALSGLVLFHGVYCGLRLQVLGKKRPKDGTLRLYARLVHLLSVWGFPMKQGETPLEYAYRMDHSLPQGKNRSFLPATEIFLKLRYGKADATKEEFEAVYAFYREIRGEVKASLGKWRYAVYRYVLGRL